MVQGTGPCCIALLPAVIATVGIAASVLSTVWCETIKFEPNIYNAYNVQNLTESTKSIFSDGDGFATAQFGLFYYSHVDNITIDSAEDAILKVKETCVYYEPEVEFDAAWKAARAFAIIAPIAAAVLALGLYVSPCCLFFTRTTWSTLALAFILVIPAFQSLTLLFLTSDACTAYDNPIIFQQLDFAASAVDALTAAPTAVNSTEEEENTRLDFSEPWEGNVTEDGQTQQALYSVYGEECQWDWGMYANLASMILFFVTGVVMMLMGPPSRPPPKEPEVQTVTYQQTTNEMGEPTVEEVNVETETIQPGSSPSWANTQSPGPGGSSVEQAKPY